MYPQNTGEHVKLIDSNIKIDLSSRIINRFQWYLVFWKTENLLFHLKTTAFHCFNFLGEKNNILEKNVGKIWKISSLAIRAYWNLVQNDCQKTRKMQNYIFPTQTKWQDTYKECSHKITARSEQKKSCEPIQTENPGLVMLTPGKQIQPQVFSRILVVWS